METVTCNLQSVPAPMCINYILTLLFLFESQTDAMTCNIKKINSIETNVSLPHHMFDKLYPGGLMLCARECKYRPRCKSFNYIESNGECQLNDDTMSGTVQNISGVVYSDINNWPETILGNCEHSYCSHLQRCEPNENSYICGYAYDNVTSANHTAFLGHTFDVVTANTEDDCVQACMLRSACLSFNYKSDSNTCELNNEVMITDYQSYIGNQLNSYYSNIDLYDRIVVGECATHTCDQYSRCEVNGGSYTCTILYCPTPTVPYTDMYVIPKFDLSKTLWSVGENLYYICWSSYYPTTDWTCLNNGTWQNPTCKALATCSDLFSKCDPDYNNGTYVFKYPGTEHNIVVDCFRGKMFPYLRIKQNTTYSYFSSKQDPTCYESKKCGRRYFTAMKIIIFTFTFQVLTFDDLDFSTTDCDGPYLFSAGKKCSGTCIENTNGSFHVDISGTGLKYLSNMTITNGIVSFSQDGQVVSGTCNDCQKSCQMSKLNMFPSFSDINLNGAVFPVCPSWK